MPRPSVVSEVLAYNVRLWAAGLAGAVFVPLSLAALVLDVVTGRTRSADALSRRVLRASARFEAALDVHGRLTEIRVADDRPARSAHGEVGDPTADRDLDPAVQAPPRRRVVRL